MDIGVGNTTNGWEWRADKDYQSAHIFLKRVRFTVAAGTPEGYSRIMFKGPQHTEVFDKAMQNIEYAVGLKRRLKLKVKLGIQMGLLPKFKDEILPFA